MTTRSYKAGPGSLTLGSAPLDVSGQFSNFQVQYAESVTGGDDINLLDGTTLAGDEVASYKATVSGTLLQDISAAGVIAWSWANKGTEQAFEFVPNDTEDRVVSGILVPVPIQIGGDVKTRQTAQITWRIIGDPEFADATP